ncbi:MAG: Spy/CpxP family protein refolding chaperone, partial [Gemmatimonadaceae bacterium]
MLRFRTVALGAALLMGMATAATAQQGERGDRGERRRGEGRRGGPMGMRRHMDQRLFQGVNLTEEQRTQFRAVHERYREQLATLRESARPDMQAAREARQKGDTAAARVAFERTSDEREQMKALAEKRQGEIRNVLTADQRTVYDRNVQELKQRMERRKGGG